MTQFRLSPLLWKWFVGAVALLSAMLLVIEFSHAVKPVLIDGAHGSLGVVLADQTGANQNGLGTHRLRIESLAPDSPLLAAGAQPGDFVKFDQYLDRYRVFAPSERVGLTLYQGAAERKLAPAALPVKITFAEYFDYCGRFLLSLPALLFGLMVAFKQSEGRSSRALAMTFLTFSLVYFYGVNYSVLSPAFALSKFLHLITNPLIWYGCAVFTLTYQPYPPSPLRAWLNRLFPWYRLLAFGTAAYGAGFALGMETPLLWLGSLLSGVCGLALSLASLVDGWRHSSGEIRQRHLWLLLSFALGAVPALLTRLPALDAMIDGLRITVMMFFAGQLLMFVGLTYAVLKYRVFNFDFAISRALVFSVVSLLLLCAFGLIEWIYATTMHGGGAAHGAQKNSLAADAILALLTYLVLHKLHGRLERGVERILFEKWHVNERKLRSYVQQAAHITTPDSLLDTFHAALDRFTGQAGCAIYLHLDSGGYALATGTLEGAPASVDFNDSAAVALRTNMKLVFVEQVHSALRGELLLPMCHRGVLDGFVLVGSKRRGYSYRPDELEALAFAANQVGLDLHALRADTLERELRELEHKGKQQQQELLLMAGRRRSTRDVAAALETGPAAIGA